MIFIICKLKYINVPQFMFTLFHLIFFCFCVWSNYNMHQITESILQALCIQRANDSAILITVTKICLVWTKLLQFKPWYDIMFLNFESSLLTCICLWKTVRPFIGIKLKRAWSRVELIFYCLLSHFMFSMH